VQLTYKEGRGFVYAASTDADHRSQGGPVREFTYDTYTGHGWGLAFDPTHRELVVSDG
jgi:glutamine cyclotransferase